MAGGRCQARCVATQRLSLDLRTLNCHNKVTSTDCVPFVSSMAEPQPNLSMISRLTGVLNLQVKMYICGEYQDT